MVSDVTAPVRTAQSRLSDDLYRLYLTALSWLLFPVYGEVFAAVLPSSPAAVEAMFAIGVVAAQIGWLWSGIRGGPMMVLQGSIVHELLAPVSPRQTLAPQLLRQSLAWAAVGAVASGLLSSLGGEFSFAVAGRVSVAGFLVGLGAIAWGVSVMAGWRSEGRRRGVLVSASFVSAIIVSTAAVLLGPVGNGTTLGIFALAAIAGFGAASFGLDEMPVASLWQRARRLESARSAFLEVDLHRMLVDLRRAGESAPVGTSRLPTGRWVSGWRWAAPIRHAMPWSLIRLAGGIAASILLIVFDALDEGVWLAAFGVAWLFIGYEITRGLAALADHIGFVSHFPGGSFRLLLGQLTASLLFGGLLIGAGAAWLLLIDSSAGAGATLLGLGGVLTGAMQARLGSPPTATFMQKYGIQMASGLLWARAAAAPLLVLTIVLLTFHGYIEPQPIYIPELIELDIAGAARAAVPLVLLAAAVTAVLPLEKALR